MSIHRLHGPTTVLVLTALLASSACTRHGVLVPGEPTPYYYDAEPNDDSRHPQPIGPLYPPEQLVIRGSVCGVWGFGYDATDAFAFQAMSPARVEFHLAAYDGTADLDLCLVDPFLEEVVAHWDSAGDEWGSFDVPGAGVDFHLVVVAYSGTSDYDLELRADPLPFHMPVPAGLRAEIPLGDAEPKEDSLLRVAPYFLGGEERERAERARAVEIALARVALERARAASESETAR
ncbi:MAG: hypothetical protein R3F34_09520 [Planctomycetota bacterium]